MEKKPKAVPFRAKEVKGKAKVWVPPGAKENLTSLPMEAPLTHYEDDRMEGDEWEKRLQGKKKDS